MLNKISNFMKRLKRKKQDELEIETVESDSTSELPELPSNIEVEKESNTKIKLNFKQKLGRFFSRFTPDKRLINKEKFEALFFTDKGQNKIHRYFQFSIIFIALFSLGKVTGVLLGDKLSTDKYVGVNYATVTTTRHMKGVDLDLIRSANIFDTGKAQIEAPIDQVKPRENIICTQSDKRSRLPIKLINTIVLQNPKKSVASLQINSGSLFSEYRTDDDIEGLASLDRIERLRIIVKNSKSGTCEYIDSAEKDKSTPRIAVLDKAQTSAFKKKAKKIDGIKNEGNQFTIERSFIKEKMKNIGDLLTQAQAVPINNPDGTISFKIISFQPGSAFDYLGIEPNDVINGIGGEKIQDMNAIMNMFSKLGGDDIKKLSLDFDRGGKKVTQDYKFQ